MSEPVTYAPEDLEQAAREARAWAGVARAHAGVHEVMATQLSGKPRRVAQALAKVARANATHADKMADIYEAEAKECR